MMVLNQVRCVKGHEGYLEEGSLYSVINVTKEGHYVLFEVDPPPPYNCFHYERFEPTDQVIGLDFDNCEIIEDLEFEVYK